MMKIFDKTPKELHNILRPDSCTHYPPRGVLTYRVHISSIEMLVWTNILADLYIVLPRTMVIWLYSDALSDARLLVQNEVS